MADVVANGVRFHVQRLGAWAEVAELGPEPVPTNEPVVVMIHGMVMDNLSSYFYTIANPVAQQSSVLLYDLRGHGKSERPPTGYKIRDSVADLVALLDTCGIDQPVHLVGNSYGGTVALATAVTHSDRVLSLALIEAHFAVDGWGETMAGSLELAGLGLEDDELQEWLEEFGSRKLNRMARNAESLIYDTTLVEDMRISAPFQPEELQSITCPTLALYGEFSDVIERAHDLERHLPNLDLRILVDNTHSVLMESTPIVREAVVDWISGSCARRTAGRERENVA